MVFDANKAQIGQVTLKNAADTLKAQSDLPAAGFSLTAHKDKDVRFRVPSGTFDSDGKGSPCESGDYDGDRKHAGKR